MLWTKRAHQSTIFQTLVCSNESAPMPFLKPQGQGSCEISKNTFIHKTPLVAASVFR